MTINTTFFEMLKGTTDPVLRLRGYADNALCNVGGGLKAVGRLSNPAVTAELSKWSSMGASNTFVVNDPVSDTAPGDTDADITRFVALFIDKDAGAPVAYPESCPPHFVNARPNHLDKHHTYWLIDPEGVTASTWSLVQKHLIAYYGSDRTMSNPSRVMRMPGRPHQKDVNDITNYEVQVANIDLPRYDINYVMAAHPLSAEQQDYFTKLVRHAAAGGERAETKGIRDVPADIEKFRKWLLTRAPIGVVSGADPSELSDDVKHRDIKGGDDSLYTIVKMAIDIGISYDVMLDVMFEWYADKCLPPWDMQTDSDEIERKYNNTLNADVAAAGSKSTSHDTERFLNIMSEVQPVALRPTLSGEVLTAMQHVETKGTETQDKETLSELRINECRQVLDAYKTALNNGEEVDRESCLGAFSSLDIMNADVLDTYFSPKGEQLIIDGNLYTHTGSYYKPNGDMNVVKLMVGRAMSGDINHCKEKLIGDTTAKLSRKWTKTPNECWPSIEDYMGNFWDSRNGVYETKGLPDARNCMAFNNGILNLDNVRPGVPLSAAVLPTSPAFINFGYNPINLDVNAKCDKFMEFLTSCFGHTAAHPDSKFAEQIELIQMIMGYILSGDRNAHMFFVLQGKPRCGKSTLGKIMRHMVGMSDSAVMKFDDFADGVTNIKYATRRMALLDDAQSYVDDEKIVGLFKSQTGGGKASGRMLYSNETVEVNTKACYVITCNDMPRINDSTRALENRVSIVEFARTFKDSQNSNLEAELLKELPGIVTFALEGLQKLRARRAAGETYQSILGTRECAMKALETFQSSTDPLYWFTKQNIVYTDNHDDAVRLDMLYRLYEMSGFGKMSPQTLATKLTSCRDARREGNRVTGLKLTDFAMRELGLIEPVTAAPILQLNTK